MGEGGASVPLVREIDVLHLGRPRVICCYEIDGVIVDPGPEVSHRQVVEALEEPPRAILLTHIHLDHAGATGRLAELWPDAEVWVHERGAPHLVDPTRLVASATRLYGEAEMARLWGEWRAVPQERLRVLQGGETIDGFEVAYTPGHASHHVSYLHEPSNVAFVGDVAGVRVPPSEYVVAPTPPPDIDVELWDASIDLVEGWAPDALALTHFGRVDDVESHLAAMRERLHETVALAAQHGQEAFEAGIADRIEQHAGELAEAYTLAAPAEHLYLGARRYLDKRAAA
jgi:glyoxylase-like metal-dependent hydrolase (beta-lactamase superfamily II)